MKNPREYIPATVIFLILTSALIYAYAQGQTYLEGPTLEIKNPLAGSNLTSPLVNVLASVKNASFISLNGRQIYSTEAGEIREQILLPLGYTILTLKVRDRFGRSLEKNVEITRSAL